MIPMGEPCNKPGHPAGPHVKCPATLTPEARLENAVRLAMKGHAHNVAAGKFLVDRDAVTAEVDRRRSASVLADAIKSVLCDRWSGFQVSERYGLDQSVLTEAIKALPEAEKERIRNLPRTPLDGVIGNLEGSVRDTERDSVPNDTASEQPKGQEDTQDAQATETREERPDEGKAKRRGKVTWANTIEPEPVVWAWKPDGGFGRIPAGSFANAAGREGTGKSSFGIWMAAQITRGTLPGSFYGKPRAVLIVAFEDSWKHTIVPRLMAAGADLSKVGRFDVVQDDDPSVVLSLPVDNRLLELVITTHEVGLVIIDPLMSVISEKIDTHRNREVRLVLDPLAALAERTGAVFLGISHFNKGAGTDPASLITGSGAFKDVPRSVFGFARDDTDDEPAWVMTQVKNSLGRHDLPSLSYVLDEATINTKKGVASVGKFRFTGESTRSVSDILGGPSTSRADAATEAENAEKWLTNYLTTQGPTEGTAVKASAEVANIALRTLQRACADIGVVAVRAGFGKGTVWRLPSQTVTVPPKKTAVAPNKPSRARNKGLARLTLVGATDEDETTDSDSCPNCQYRYDTDEHARLCEGAEPEVRPGFCQACRNRLDPALIAEGHQTHPGCDGGATA